jgi:glycosyltransferase involved in cell wall biosynthesis
MNLTQKDNTLVSICIPVLNEEQAIPALVARLDSVALKLPAYSFEYIFSDNASTDNTWQTILDCAKNNSRIRAMRFSKNFGFQNSIVTNYAHASGRAVIQIDADLQDPPELISDFLAKWEEGFKVVYGIRQERPEGLLIRLFRNSGYRFIDALSEHRIPRNVGDFRLIDESVVQEILKQSHSNIYLRGLVASLGFSEIGIPYSRNSRTVGESKFPVKKIFTLGMAGLLNYSTVPLRLATYLGGFVLLMTSLGALYSIASYFMVDNIPRGFTSTQVYLLASIGLNSFFLGIIGEYILRIYRILRKDPVAIIEKSINL